MSDTKRWMVTYTKHLKQKRKVYQDGILEVHCLGKKVLLYDDCEKVIDSRFLKKDETIDHGKVLALEAHIVDVGDPAENNKPIADLNLCVEKLQNKAGTRLLTGMKDGKLSKLQHDFSQGRNNVITEWNVLYTTQISQKAKKYHDGILQVLASVSDMYQVILLSEAGEILSGKYLRSVESLDTGKNYELPNHLLQICEQKFPEKVPKEASSAIVECSLSPSSSEFVSAKSLVLEKKRSCEAQLKSATSSSIRTSTRNINASSNKILRDASAILTTLKRPGGEDYNSGFALNEQSKKKISETNLLLPENQTFFAEESYQDIPSKICTEYSSMIDRLISRAPQVVCSTTTNVANDQPCSSSGTHDFSADLQQNQPVENTNLLTNTKLPHANSEACESTTSSGTERDQRPTQVLLETNRRKTKIPSFDLGI